MNKLAAKYWPLFFVFLLLTACGSDGGNSGPSYKEMKSMVVDILKTDEAKKAIEEATQKEKQKEDEKLIQMLSSPQGQQVQLAVKEVLTDPKYPQVLKEMMTDPKFAGDFAKAVQKENKEIHKHLMKDPEYQTLLLETMKDPEFEKMFIEVMKGKAYRQQMMTTMKEALDNPIFKVQMIELITKALEEQSKPKSKKGGGGGGGGGGESGGGGDGGGNQGGDGGGA